MGRLFWFGMVGVIAATVGFGLTAIYVSRHPDSLFVRYGRAALRVETNCQSAFEVGQTIVWKAGRVLLDPDRQVEAEEDTALCIPDDPQPVEEAVSAGQEPVLLMDNQVVKAIREQLPSIPFQDAKEPPLAEGPEADTPPEGNNLQSGPPTSPEPLIFPGAVTTTDIDEEQKMPRCYEDEPDSPSRMPGAEQSETMPATDALFRFWLDLFRKAGEESEDAEESEPLYEESLPPCQEDPAYHYQYPGCPFTGKDPFEGRAGLKLDVPQDETKQKKGSMTPDFDPNSLDIPERLKRLLPQAGSEDEESLPPPNVDTTEFRPSDAKPGEFDPQPM